ncbi:lipid A biosynthesis lauroyl acyltransferase [Helicobacter pametensis]|uniref:lipid A biosynthesis lauroyl acyltransferase n=1 Tax=Helicobacter pametensis TaxID=95149 RepID=UPI0004B28A4A|nr:lipid A biosynthesis lauroyl acyltransferase [Helicobacter pametensis]
MKTLLGYLVVIVIRLLARFLAILPHRAFILCVDFLAFIFRIFDSRRYKDAKSNLDFVFASSKTQEEKHRIILRSYRNFAFVLLQALRAIYLKKEKHFKDFDFENLHYLTDCVKEGRSAVMISAHFGYWEAIGSALPRFAEGYGRYSLGRLTQFEAINQLIIQSRQAYGVQLIDKHKALKTLLKLYTKPKQIAGIIIDQNVSPNEGVWVKFFDKEVTHTPVASILSRRFGIEILPVFIDFNEDYTRFKVIFCKPFACANTDNMQQDILQATQQQASLTQQIIHSHPESYFWFHKRFKSKYPEIYDHQ